MMQTKILYHLTVCCFIDLKFFIILNSSINFVEDNDNTMYVQLQLKILPQLFFFFLMYLLIKLKMFFRSKIIEP